MERYSICSLDKNTQYFTYIDSLPINLHFSEISVKWALISQFWDSSEIEFSGIFLKVDEKMWCMPDI